MPAHSTALTCRTSGVRSEFSSPEIYDLLRSKGLDPVDKALRGLFAWTNPEVGMLRNAEFLCNVAGYDEDMLWSNPMVLVYSFEQRVEPRERFAMHLCENIKGCDEGLMQW